MPTDNMLNNSPDTRTAFLASSVLPAEQVSGAYNIRDESDEVDFPFCGDRGRHLSFFSRVVKP